MSTFKIDKYSLSLSLTLEGIMMSTFRQEAANSSIIFIQNQDPTHCISPSNLSELICSRLVDNRENGGAVGYLSNCYKRLILKESGSDDKMRIDLNR
jgi:hypothetical protein